MDMKVSCIWMHTDCLVCGGSVCGVSVYISCVVRLGECLLYVENLPVVDAVYEGVPCVPGMCTRVGVSQQQGTEQQAVLF